MLDGGWLVVVVVVVLLVVAVRRDWSLHRMVLCLRVPGMSCVLGWCCVVVFAVVTLVVLFVVMVVVMVVALTVAGGFVVVHLYCLPSLASLSAACIAD